MSVPTIEEIGAQASFPSRDSQASARRSPAYVVLLMSLDAVGETLVLWGSKRCP